ncbi:MAG: class I SAM-dependent methyltransferase [Polyangiaceae bacterium]
MAGGYEQGAESVRAQIERGESDPASFRAALLSVPPAERDAWLDRVLGLGEIPDDEPALPTGCVPYLPCAVDALLRVVEHAPVCESDVVVDIGAGVGRAAALLHLTTGATVIGLEIQPRLVAAARDLAERLLLSRTTCVEGDAVKLARLMSIGSIFFLYCPFSGERLRALVASLEDVARTKTIRICCVDVPMPYVPWLVPESVAPDLMIYRSTLY